MSTSCNEPSYWFIAAGTHQTALLTGYNKNLCGRDGRTICGPQCMPKSTSVTLAVDKKTLGVTDGNDNGTDGQTDRQSATQYAAPPREEGRIINVDVVELRAQADASMALAYARLPASDNNVNNTQYSLL